MVISFSDLLLSFHSSKIFFDSLLRVLSASWSYHFLIKSNNIRRSPRIASTPLAPPVHGVPKNPARAINAPTIKARYSSRWQNQDYRKHHIMLQALFLIRISWSEWSSVGFPFLFFPHQLFLSRFFFASSASNGGLYSVGDFWGDFPSSFNLSITCWFWKNKLLSCKCNSSDSSLERSALSRNLNAR